MLRWTWTNVITADPSFPKDGGDGADHGSPSLCLQNIWAEGQEHARDGGSLTSHWSSGKLQTYSCLLHFSLVSHGVTCSIFSSFHPQSGVFSFVCGSVWIKFAPVVTDVSIKSVQKCTCLLQTVFVPICQISHGSHPGFDTIKFLSVQMCSNVASQSASGSTTLFQVFGTNETFIDHH